jgi:hypothetical protein
MSQDSLCGRIVLLASVFAISLLAASSANAQESPQPSPVQSQAPAPAPTPDAPSSTTHAFWDRTNILLFSGVAVFRGLDYASTRNFLARGRDEVLIPDDIVNNSAAFASLEAAGTLTSVGLSYLLHRTRHHKLERWLSIGHISVTGFGVVRNYSLKSKHP